MPKPVKLQAALANWYAEHGRHSLPWRNTDDAYAIWVSEVMLQQTQVKTVLERFYFPFLERFPNVNALAKADLQEVLQLWQGLGYYSRARNLHKAAQEIAAQKRNTLPADVPALMALPGIGRNTAHAIASFAFGQQVPVMEANVKRILHRFFAVKTADDKTLWAKAAELLGDTADPFTHNQAMMDVGALICTPKAPRCDACPLAAGCAGKTNPLAFPQKKAKPAIPLRRETILLQVDAKGRYAIRPRTGKFLHGLWEFPTASTIPRTAQKIGEISHAYSHFQLQAGVYLIEGWIPAFAGMTNNSTEEWHWKTAAEIATLPLSRTEKKVLKLLSASGIVAA